MSLLDTLEPDFKPWAQALFDLAVKAGVKPRITSARRSYAKQQALYRAWINGHSRFPAAPPGTSAHEYGYAFDMLVDNGRDQADLGTVWTQWGGIYGGQQDPVHFEAPFTPPTATSTGSAAQPSGAPSSSSLRKRLAEATDLFLSFVPSPVRGIVNIASLSNAILQAASGRESTLLYWTSHPQEFFNDLYDVWWTIVKSYF